VPVEIGWAVMPSEKREVAGFAGASAKRKALRPFATANPLRPPPRLAVVAEVADDLGGWRGDRDSVEPDEVDSSSLRRP